MTHEGLCRELDYCVGELQRAALFLEICRTHFGVENHVRFDRTLETITTCVTSAKAAMMVCGYSPGSAPVKE